MSPSVFLPLYFSLLYRKTRRKSIIKSTISINHRPKIFRKQFNDLHAYSHMIVFKNDISDSRWRTFRHSIMRISCSCSATGVSSGTSKKSFKEILSESHINPRFSTVILFSPSSTERMKLCDNPHRFASRLVVIPAASRSSVIRFPTFMAIFTHLFL